MRRKDWARILDPSQHIYSHAQPDPFAPAGTGRPTAPPALHAEIRRRLSAGVAVRKSELAHNFGLGHTSVETAIAYEKGRIAGERENAHKIAVLEEQLETARQAVKEARREASRRIPLDAEKRAWLDKLIHEVALNQRFFTFGDIVEANQAHDGPAISHIGPRLDAAARLGICKKTKHQTHLVKRHAQCHDTTKPARVWQSLLFRTKPEPVELTDASFAAA